MEIIFDLIDTFKKFLEKNKDLLKTNKNLKTNLYPLPCLKMPKIYLYHQLRTSF